MTRVLWFGNGGYLSAGSTTNFPESVQRAYRVKQLKKFYNGLSIL